MKIGDRIYVRGYVDEICKDTVIVRNNGGYFGTIPSEVITGELPSAQPDLSSYSDKLWRNAYERGKAEAEAEIVHCKDCVHHIDGFFCRQANHHTSDNDFCAIVFGAERRTDE